MNIIELNDKTYTFPADITELTLGTYEKIQTIVVKDINKDFTYDDVITIISYLTGISRDDILSAPAEFFDSLYSLCKWIFYIDVSKLEPKSSIEINNEGYTYNPTSNISLKEWVDIDAVLKNYPDDNKLSAILAIRLRKKDEKYESEIIENRMQIFKSALLIDLYPVFFYSLLTENLSSTLTKTYSAVLELAQSQQEQNEELEKNGVGGRRLSLLQRMMLHKLNQSYKQILTTCSLIYRSALIKQTQSEKQKESVK